MDYQKNIGKVLELWEDNSENSFGTIIEAGPDDGGVPRYIVDWHDGYQKSSVWIGSKAIVGIN